MMPTKQEALALKFLAQVTAIPGQIKDLSLVVGLSQAKVRITGFIMVQYKA
jgi:hypothetical protein